MSTTRALAVVYIATSLDRFIARKDGSIDWLGSPDPNEDHGWTDFVSSIDHIVIGRKTFETVLSFGGAWPYSGTPLTVLSRTLSSVPKHLQGEVSISHLEPLALLTELAEKGSRRVYVDGGKTIQSFLHADLIDELVLTTLPILIGEGIPLFGSLREDLTWKHVTTEAFRSGLTQSTYRRDRH